MTLNSHKPAQTTQESTPWVIHCDGSAVPNPGRMGLGAVLVGPDGTAQHTLSEATTFTGCNNEAEIRALLAALKSLAELALPACTTVRVYSDSRVLVDQLTAQAAPPIVRLAPLVDAARSAMAQFQHVDLLWIPRHRNGAADRLARAALGLAPKLTNPTGQKRRRRLGPPSV